MVDAGKIKKEPILQLKNRKKNIVKRFVFFFGFVVMLGNNVHAQEPKFKKIPVKYRVSEKGDTQVGLASFYANKFNGRKTANGEIFSQSKFTCACNIAPLGTWIKVTNLSNGNSVIVKINDRLHPRMNRLVDLSKVAATRLDYIGKGLTRVRVEVIGKAGRL